MAGESLRQQPLHWWLSQWGQSHGPADLCKMHRRICYGCYAMPQIVWRRFCRIITTAVQQISKDAKFLIGSSIVKKSQIYLHTSHVGKAGGFSQYLCPVYASVCLSVCLSVQKLKTPDQKLKLVRICVMMKLEVIRFQWHLTSTFWPWQLFVYTLYACHQFWLSRSNMPTFI